MQKNQLAAATILSLLLFPITIWAQNEKETYEVYKKRIQSEYSNYKEKKKEDYENFRKKANEEYAQYLIGNWELYHAFKGIIPPTPDPIPPVVCPEEERQKEREDIVAPVEDIIVMELPKPQPVPVVPIQQPTPPKPSPSPVQQHPDSLSLLFYGTKISYHLASRPQFSLSGLDDYSIAKSWKNLSNGQCDGLLSQCLALRSRLRLNDWAYILLIDKICSEVIGTSGNKTTLMMAWLYCQSGYKMRLAHSDGQLYMLFASDNTIYYSNFFTLEGERFYVYKDKSDKDMYICDITFPNERTMTLRMVDEPRMAVNMSQPRTLQSKRYPALKVQTTVNRNLIDFYNDYPKGGTGHTFGCEWAMYAGVPLGEDAQQKLYPQLCEALSGVGNLQAAQMLLNFVQTAFVYEYDDKVWGGDRAYFAEETLFYPYSDCEDRSILFSRLVRDMLGLDVVLVYYPGHIATAVRFEEEQPTGDYIQLEEGRYFIADPTYSDADIGMTMPRYKGSKLTVIRPN